jgi:hypothetical protein
MLRRILSAALLLGAALTSQRPAEAACASGFISIVDPFLLPNSTPWSGSIVYTLAYNTTVAGATIVGSRQQFNVANGVNICLAPGLYTPVTMNQGGISYTVTQSWGVPATGGPYTIAQIQGTVALSQGQLYSNTVTLTNSQVLALQTIPVVLVPAPAANVVIMPERIGIEIQNCYYSTPSQVLWIGAGATIGSSTVIGDFGPFDPNGDAVYLDSYFFPGTINGMSSSFAGQQVIGYVTDTMSQMGGTGGNVTITTWYVTFTVQ